MRGGTRTEIEAPHPLAEPILHLPYLRICVSTMFSHKFVKLRMSSPINALRTLYKRSSGDAIICSKSWISNSAPLSHES